MIWFLKEKMWKVVPQKTVPANVLKMAHGPTPYPVDRLVGLTTGRLTHSSWEVASECGVLTSSQRCLRTLRETFSNSPAVWGCSPWETRLVQGRGARTYLGSSVFGTNRISYDHLPVNSLGLCLHSEKKIVSVANFLLQGSFYSGHKPWWTI